MPYNGTIVLMNVGILCALGNVAVVGIARMSQRQPCLALSPAKCDSHPYETVFVLLILS